MRPNSIAVNQDIIYKWITKLVEFSEKGMHFRDISQWNECELCKPLNLMT